MKEIYIITLGDEYDNDMGVYGVFEDIEEAFAHGKELGETNKSLSVLVTPFDLNTGRDSDYRSQAYRYSWELGEFRLRQF